MRILDQEDCRYGVEYCDHIGYDIEEDYHRIRDTKRDHICAGIVNGYKEEDDLKAK